MSAARHSAEYRRLADRWDDRLWPFVARLERRVGVDSSHPSEESEPDFGEWLAERSSVFHHPVMVFRSGREPGNRLRIILEILTHTLKNNTH